MLLTVTLALPIVAQTTQKPSAQQAVTVVVVNAHAQPAQPVRAVRVSLSYVDNGTRVTEAREVTSQKGEAYLTVSTDAAQRGDLRLEISGVSDLVIYQPADGQLAGLPGRITLNLLPRGSPALLGPTQIEALLHRTLLQVNLQQKQIQALKNQKPDLSAALAEVAQAYGFAPVDFNKKVEGWAHDVQADPAADARKRALAEVALKNYAEAHKLFDEASADDDKTLDEEDRRHEQVLEVLRKALRQKLQDAQGSANASQLNLQYHQATGTLESTRARAATEHKRYPDDPALHDIWMDATFALAGALVAEGEVASASQSLPLLAQAADAYQTLAREYLALGDRSNAAAAQVGWGNALLREGERANGENSAQSLAQAVQAFQNALEILTKAEYPQNWAQIQLCLGTALMDEGERASGDKAQALLEQSVQAFRRALEVDTQADHPQDWALTQNDLGIALKDQAERATSETFGALLDQAVQAFRSALEVRTRADLPEDWAQTQLNLGSALRDEGERVGYDKSSALLAQAVQAFCSALEVYTKADLPQEWAATQSSLGITLKDEGSRASGEKATALFDQAVQAFRSALEVYTKADLPQDWARTQNNLGIALKVEAERFTGTQAIALFDQAVQAYRGALEVRTKADLPQAWALTQNNLGNALDNEGALTPGEKGSELFEQAVQAYRSALEVRTKAALPQDWASTQNNLGNALDNEGLRATSKQQAIALFEQAAQAYRSALEVYTRADLPQQWAMAQNNLGTALQQEGMSSQGNPSATLLNQAAQAYQSALEVRTKTTDPYHWAQTMRNLAIVYNAQGNTAAAQQTTAEANSVKRQ